MSTLSTIAMYDDLRRCEYVLMHGLAEEEFLRFARQQDEYREQWLNAVNEAQRVQRELDAALHKIGDMETKLFHARRLLEMENKSRKEAEFDREQLDKKMSAVQDLLLNDRDLRDETRSKIERLNYCPKKRKSVNDHHLEEFGNEINSTGSFLSNLSVTQSEDDFLDVGRPSKGWKKHRPSFPEHSGVYVGGKRSRKSNDGLRKSINNNKFIEIGSHDKFVATTKVNLPQGDGPITAESIIEAIPHFEEPIKHKSPQKQSPKKAFAPSAPEETHLPKPQLFSDFTFKKNMRAHSFNTKTFLRSDTCAYCQNRIKFGNVALKCRECRICIHTDCKEMRSIACVPQSAGTPTIKGGAMGLISDYTPNVGPMVPAIIVHCVNEIETRGLSEVGLYRVSGSERDVKALKERFLRGKATPFLGGIDIHVLCGCLKDFLRSLREPLIPTSLWKDFSNAEQNVSSTESERQLYAAIDRLPQANRDTLAFLLQHFQRIAESTEVKMPLSNLAKVFGPTIVGYSSPEPDQHTIYTETVIQANVMARLLDVPTDFWSRYVNVDLNKENQFESTENITKSYFGTPTSLLRSTKQKKCKFYSTPPYTPKVKKI